MSENELNRHGEWSNNHYEGGSDMCSLVDGLTQAWNTRDDLKANFGSRDLYFKTNLEAFEAARLAAGKGVAEFIGIFTIVDHP